MLSVSFATWLAIIVRLLTIDAEAQQFKPHHVGVLMLIRSDRPQLQGLRDGLREAGFIQNQNLLLQMPALRTPEEARLVAVRFEQQKVKVIVTTGNVETEIAKDLTRDLPIVFMPASDPIAAGFVQSFPRPGTNLTGVALTRDLDAYGKQLAVFKEVVPSLSKLAVVYDGRSDDSLYVKGLAPLKRVASHLAIDLDERPIRDIIEAEKVVGSLSRNAIGGVLVLCSSLFGSGPEGMIQRAVEKKLPLFSCGWTERGALVSYGLNFYQVGRRGGWYVGRILRGAKPHDLAVESPKNYELAINIKTASAIGLKIPVEVLQRADRIIR